jgi:hypothetical protein
MVRDANTISCQAIHKLSNRAAASSTKLEPREHRASISDGQQTPDILNSAWNPFQTWVLGNQESKWIRCVFVDLEMKVGKMAARETGAGLHNAETQGRLEQLTSVHFLDIVHIHI